MGERSFDALQARVQLLERELCHREAEIEMLRQVGDAVAGERRVDRVLQLVAERARDLINAETVLLPILNSECSEYTYRAGCGASAEEIVGESLPLDFGICGWVWRHKRAWWRGVLDELEEHERTKWEHEARTVILIPLVGKQHFLGGLAAINKRGGAEFDQRDLDLLTMFAQQVSIAIENATYFEAMERARQEAERYQRELKALNRDLAETARELEHMALHDALTGLPNRSLVQDRMQQAVYQARRDHKPFAVIVVDLDYFKAVNDTLGHPVGDQLLKEVSKRFAETLRQVDTVGRLGGDEFAVVVPGADGEAASLVANHLLQSLEAPFAQGEQILTVTASLGIALFPEHGTDVATLLKRADVAMYVAKRPRDGYFIYDTARDENNPGRLALVSDIRHAIQAHQLELYYQPQLDLKTHTITGVEALVRWPHPDRGFIPPRSLHSGARTNRPYPLVHGLGARHRAAPTTGMVQARTRSQHVRESFRSQSARRTAPASARHLVEAVSDPP